MEFFIPDTSMYVAFVILTTFFFYVTARLTASHTVSRQASLQQESSYLQQYSFACSNSTSIPSIYTRYNLTCSVRRQEASSEQDSEGPYIPMIFA